MRKIVIIVLLFTSLFSFSQKVNNEIVKGNEAYKKGNYKNAVTAYNSALAIDGKNATAQYNKGNVLYKQKQLVDATQAYKTAGENANNATTQSQAFYNKGVAEANQKQWQEALNSFKQSLRLQPSDKEARENLQKVLNELKQQDKQQDKNKQDDKKQNKKDQQKKKEQQPKMNKQQMENEFNKLSNEEKRLQQDVQKQRTKQVAGGRDW